MDTPEKKSIPSTGAKQTRNPAGLTKRQQRHDLTCAVLSGMSLNTLDSGGRQSNIEREVLRVRSSVKFYVDAMMEAPLD